MGAGAGACGACKPVRRKLVELVALSRTSHQDGTAPVMEAGERWAPRETRGRLSSPTAGTAMVLRSHRAEQDGETAYVGWPMCARVAGKGG